MIKSRREFACGILGVAATGATAQFVFADEEEKKPKQPEKKPIEAEFTRDYEPPKFKPSWKNKVLNRTMVQDFVIFAHSDLKMVEKLYNREPMLLNGTMDWGNGDWENALNGASHMGKKDIVEFLLSKGARMDIFCSTMMGKLEIVKSMLELQPALIDARGPHGFDLHFHAQVGGDESKPVLDFLQSIKEKKLRKIPFLSRKNKKKD